MPPAGILVAILLSTRQGSDSAHVIGDLVSCRQCMITASPVLTLARRDSGLVEHPQSAASDGRGNYYVTQPNHGEMPMVFGADGRFRGKLGRPGKGPGEFTAAAYVAIGAGDTAFVADWTGRLSVFGPGGRPHIRSFVVPPSARAIQILTDGSIVLNSSVFDRETVGLAFHFYRADGYRFGATGDRSTPYLPSTDIFFVHRLGRAPDARVWSLRFMGEYRMERWRRDGARELFLVRRPSWFIGLPPRLRGVDTNTLEPPPSQGLAIWEDDSGLLWTMMLVPDPKRFRAQRDTVRTPEGDLRSFRRPDLAWDTIVEVIDIRARALVASRRFDEVFAPSLGGGFVLQVVERPDGLFMAHVVKLSLTHRGR